MNTPTDASAGEVWRDVPGSGGRYRVSNRGRVESIRTTPTGRVYRKILKPAIRQSGHHKVWLRINELDRMYGIHALVLSAFVGPRPDGMEACHWNDQPGDNRIENLRWGTRSDNVRDSIRNGTHFFASKSKCKRGHDLSGANLYLIPKGGRACKACKYALSRKCENAAIDLQKVSDRKYAELTGWANNGK